MGMFSLCVLLVLAPDCQFSVFLQLGFLSVNFFLIAPFITKNSPMQYTEIFFPKKWKILLEKMIFSIFMLKPLIVGTRSNEYPQSLSWIQYKENTCIPVYPRFT